MCQDIRTSQTNVRACEDVKIQRCQEVSMFFIFKEHQGLAFECQLSRISGSQRPSCFSCVQEKLVNSMTQEDFEPASCPEDEVSFPVLSCNKSMKEYSRRRMTVTSSSKILCIHGVVGKYGDGWERPPSLLFSAANGQKY
jgi:hypothetical protein